MEVEVRRLKGMLEPLMASVPTRTPTEHPHIERVEGVCGGEPVIEGTRIPVQDAIGYYHNHKEEIERAIYQNSEEYNREWLEKNRV